LSELNKTRFIVLDGPDGCGKSTQQKFLAEYFQASGVNVLTCRDPGGTAIGDRIRSILLDHDLAAMDVNCETLLFMASRAQLVGEIIRPALDAGKTVLCDRFVSSTVAYQGAAGYDPRRVIDLAVFAIGNLWPDLTVILDLDVEEGFRRIGRTPQLAGKHRRKSMGQGALFEGGHPADAMEARPLEFHRRVRELFLELPSFFPASVKIIDAMGEPKTVHNRIVECLKLVTG
jgi:dTMP kinase